MDLSGLLFSWSTTKLAIFVAVASSAYTVGLAVYRLFFHPIARFPGPKIAAVTRWYEFYYEVILGGQFTFHIQDLHKKYGPIVRITPNELHIVDSDYFEELFTRSGKLDKYKPFSARFGTDDTFFTAPSHEVHRRLRAAVAPYFSRRKITDFEPTIRAKLRKLCAKIAEYASTGETLRLDRAWTAFTGDIVTEFCFAKAYDHLDSPGFQETFHEAMIAACKSSTMLMMFPYLWRIINILPDWLVIKLNPDMGMHVQVQQDFKKTLTALKENHDESHKTADHPTLFHEMLNSDLSPREKSIERMMQEAQVIIGAAILTTSWSAAVASFHIINTPQIFQKLRAELETAIPDPAIIPAWQTLEELPYLKGCIREGIRLSYGTTARMPRVARKDLMYDNWLIPAGTPVSMSLIDLNHDEEIFPDSRSFVPERWVGNPTAPNGEPLEKYFAGFGKGARSCIGLNVSQAELYIGLAAIFRNFTFELYETDLSDTLMVADFFAPVVKDDSKGIRVKVKTAELKFSDARR